jgi:hypothetical protein
LYGGQHGSGDMLKVFVGNKKDPFALCIMQVDVSWYGKAIETNYPNSVEGMTKGLSHITSILEGVCNGPRYVFNGVEVFPQL